VLAELEGELLRVARDLEEALKRAEEGIARVRSSWEARKRQVQEQYEKILRELQKSSVDGEEFIRLRRGIEELELAPTTAIRLNPFPPEVLPSGRRWKIFPPAKRQRQCSFFCY